jgi:hypothetical protein
VVFAKTIGILDNPGQGISPIVDPAEPILP